MTKTALVTTTINVPTVLRLYRALDADVRFFVAGDQKSPLNEINDLCLQLDNATWTLTGNNMAYACSEPIGWNSIQRRNIATLEALRWGADLIVSIDDDNIPLGKYFSEFNFANHDGLQVNPFGWFDVGEWAFPRDGIDPVVQRGIPQNLVRGAEITHVVGAKIGVAQGLILGDPDTSAVDRLSRSPMVHQVSEVLRAGIVVDPRTTKTVFNSQNTAFVRELAPAMFMIPGIGRYDDIFASLVCQRVMRQHGYVTHFGPPFCWQQRNAHDLIKDLKAEIFGMEHIVEFAEWLDGLCLASSVLGDVRYIYTAMADLKWMPPQAYEAGRAWCDDCEKVM